MKEQLRIFGLVSLLLFSFSTCNSTKKTPDPSGGEKVELPGQLYVWLKETAKVEKIEIAFADFELKSKGPASRTEKKYLFHFAKDRISSADLIKKLEAHRGVEKAQIVMMKKS